MLGETQVDDNDLNILFGVLADHDVLQFQIPMHNSLGMKILDSL